MNHPAPLNQPWPPQKALSLLNLPQVIRSLPGDQTAQLIEVQIQVQERHPRPGEAKEWAAKGVTMGGGPC